MRLLREGRRGSKYACLGICSRRKYIHTGGERALPAVCVCGAGEEITVKENQRGFLKVCMMHAGGEGGDELPC